jgi:hypothetical protein
MTAIPQKLAPLSKFGSVARCLLRLKIGGAASQNSFPARKR